MRTCAFIFLGLLLVALFTVEPRIPPVPKPWKLSAFFQPLLEPAFLYCTLGLVFFSWGMFVPFNYLVLEAENRGMDSDLANYQISILNGARWVLQHSSPRPYSGNNTTLPPPFPKLPPSPPSKSPGHPSQNSLPLTASI